MFSMGSFRNRQKATESPRGSPRNANNNGSSPAESPRVEVGEIDTRAPFQSVKAAVSLFGDVVSKKRPVIKRSTKPTSSENVIDKETQLIFAQNELNKLKEHLKNLETTKARGISDLERANKAMEELTNKLKIVSESKLSAIQITEDAKNQVSQLEASKSSTSPRTPRDGGAWKQDLDEAKEQYVTTFAELDAAKQLLTKVRQDFDSALDSKMVAFEQAADAQYATKFNTDRINELSKEIDALRESRNQVRVETERACEELTKILDEKNAREEAHKLVMDEAKNKLKTQKEESDPELMIVIEKKLAETNAEIEALQEQMENVRESDMESIRIITLELNEATKTLQQVAEEESELQSLVDSLRIELESVRSEWMTKSEVKSESVVDDLRVKLQEWKDELETAIMEETKAIEIYDDTILRIQEITLQAENTYRKTTELKKDALQFKQEAETARVAMEESEEKVLAAVKEANDAEDAAKFAMDEMTILSETTKNCLRDSDSGPTSQIKLSGEEFESLSRKAEESENSAETKLLEAQTQLQAIHASQDETDKMMMVNLEEVEEIAEATEVALKQAEMADAAKRALEGELRRLSQQEKNKGKQETRN